MHNLAAARTVVLIVEDEPVQRMMLIDMVEEAGFDPVVAMGANDAVRILEARTDIRIVFSDYDMPGGPAGMRLAATIRDRWPPIELIITSTGKRDPSIDDLPARAVFFSKPYSRERVIATMQRFDNSVDRHG